MRMTPVAHEKIAQFLADLDDHRLRVAQLATGGGCCAKLNLGVTLDDALEDEDEVIAIDGVEVVIDRALHQTLGEVIIDFCPENGIVVRTVHSSSGACLKGNGQS